MKRHRFDRRFYVVTAALAAANVALLGLLLIPKTRSQVHQSISETAALARSVTTPRGEEEHPPLRAEVDRFRTNPGGEFARLASLFQSEFQEETLVSGDFTTVSTSLEEVTSPNASPYAHTAIGAVIEANGGRIPATGTELERALRKLGDFAQLSIPFSSVALDSGLTHPRVVITQRPASAPGLKEDPETPNHSKTSSPAARSSLLGTALANQRNLEGRLYLAANMHAGPHGNDPWVKTVEFISWNSRYLKFDFGMIEGLGETPAVKFVDGIRCVTCHKNKGPILGNNPWSNTTHDRAILSATTHHFERDPQSSFDGMKLMAPRASVVDAGVRAGADLLQNRKIFRALIRAPGGREAVLQMLGAMVESGPLESLDEKIKPRINGADLTRFMVDAVALNKAVLPSTLVDFNPGESLGGRPMGWCGDRTLVAEYDNTRAGGKHGLTTKNLPSNPKAFLKPPARLPGLPSDLVSAIMLARTIGLTEGDRTFFAGTLASAAKAAGRLHVDPATIARRVFDGPEFSDVFASGSLPDRDDFKDRFLTGLRGALKTNDVPVDFLPARDTYASGPRRGSEDQRRRHRLRARADNLVPAVPRRPRSRKEDADGTDPASGIRPVRQGRPPGLDRKLRRQEQRPRLESHVEADGHRRGHAADGLVGVQDVPRQGPGIVRRGQTVLDGRTQQSQGRLS